MVVDWTRDEMLSAVRASLTGRARSSWTFERADLDGEEVLVVFDVNAERFRVRYSLLDLPYGVNTEKSATRPENGRRKSGGTSRCRSTPVAYCEPTGHLNTTVLSN